MSLPGRIFYHGWHQPLAYLHSLCLDGGPWQRARTHRGRHDMRAAASQLTPPAPAYGQPLCVTLLTGARFWDMSVFCLVSLARASQRPLHPTILDDGTLPESAAETLLRLFPATIIESTATLNARLDELLPEKKFPVLRAHRQTFPLLRKLTDVFVGQTSWRLFLDSDLLFFQSPSELITWADQPTQPLHGRDLKNAYGYSLEILGELAGKPVPERVNTGTLGLLGTEIDWPRLENACATLLQKHGTNYFLEQALVAIHLVGRTCTVLPPERYILCPRPPESTACQAVMHHYVAESKRWYFQSNWRRFTTT